MNIVKGIEIIDDATAMEKFEKQVRSKGLPVLQVGSDKTIYAVGESEQEREKFNETVEENAFTLNLDYARAKLIYVDKDTGQMHESKKVMERFISETDIDDISEGIPISLLPDLMDFIGDSNSLIKEDIAETFQKEDLAENNATTPVQEKVNEEASQDPSEDDDEFVDDVEETLQSDKDPVTTAGATDERDSGIEESPEQEESEQVEAEETPAQENEVETDPESGHQEKENQDYLMEKAIELFDSHNPMSLPEFDELTHKGLQERVLESQFTVREARDKGINEIYHRLKDETSESVETIRSNIIEGARKKHEEALNKIDRNYKYDVEKLLNEHNAEYEKDREDYIQSQIPLLRKQYDAEYYPNYESVLNGEIERLREQSNNEKSKEIDKFESYVDQVLNDSQERAMNAVRVEDIIEEYNKVAEEQKELLLYEARQKKGEIGSAMHEMVQERDRLKQEISEVQEQLEKQKASEQERINSGVSASMREKEQDIRQENKEELDQAYNRQQDLLRQVEQLEQALEQEKQEKDNMKTEYVAPPQESSSKEIAAGTEAFYPSQMQSAETSKFGKIKFAVGCGISVLILLILGMGLSKVGGMLGGVQNEMAKDNKLSELSYLADLEADERYDKTADEMEKFGYDQEDIADMYMEHNHYISALKTNKGILPEVYEYAESKNDEENHRKILENVRDSETLKGKYQGGVEARLAILNDDADKVYNMTLDEKVDNGSAKKSIQYFIDQEDFSKADDLLTVYSDKTLSEELENTMQSKQDKAVENFEGVVESLEDDIEDTEEEADKLNEELDEADQQQEEQEKRKEIKKNDEKKKDLEMKLEDKNKKLEELKEEDQEEDQE